MIIFFLLRRGRLKKEMFAALGRMLRFGVTEPEERSCFERGEPPPSRRYYNYIQSPMMNTAVRRHHIGGFHMKLDDPTYQGMTHFSSSSPSRRREKHSLQEPMTITSGSDKHHHRSHKRDHHHRHSKKLIPQLVLLDPKTGRIYT